MFWIGFLSGAGTALFMIALLILWGAKTEKEEDYT